MTSCYGDTTFFTCVVPTALEQTEEQLLAEVLRAHVICVIYAVDDEDTLDKVRLPLRSFLGYQEQPRWFGARS